MASKVQQSEQEQAYQTLLSQGHDLAWAGDWQAAADAYRRAVALRADDPLAFIDLGLALFETGQLRPAAEAYQRALLLQPGDVAALQKVADIHALLGERFQAASGYLLLGDHFMKQRDPVQAVRAWQQAVRYDPQNRPAYQRLAEAYQRGRRPDLAAQALLAHARLCVESGEREDATVLARQALSLNPDFVAAQQLLSRLSPSTHPPRRGTGALRRGGTGPLRAQPEAQEPSPQGEEGGRDSGPTPTEVAQQRALARMAETFFDEGGSDLALEAMKAEAIDLQTRGLVQEAARAFEAVIEAGGGSPDLYYMLGTQYQVVFRFDEAIAIFRRVTATPEYAMVAHFAIGQCFQHQGRMEEARDAFLAALDGVELTRVERDEVDTVMGVYEGLIDSYEALSAHEQAAQVTTQLADFLATRGWEDKLNELRTRIVGSDVAASAEVLLDLTVSDEVLAVVETATRYRAQGHVRAAIDELYAALPLSATYLPMHMLLAELFLEDGRPDDAVTKLVTVAELYEVRGSPMQAVQALRRALDISPTELYIRSHLIGLLTSHGEIDAALEHYLYLADGYYQQAQGERAIEKLNEALRIAPRGNPAHDWAFQIHQRLADMHLQRLDWRRAAAAYEGILSAHPDDMEAAQRLADLYFKLGAEERALQTIESTARYLQERAGPLAMISFVQSQLDSQPTSLPLLRMVGEMQAQLGDVEGAAAKWERAVEQLMRQQQRAQAAALLRQIVALHSREEPRFRAMLSYLMKN